MTKIKVWLGIITGVLVLILLGIGLMSFVYGKEVADDTKNAFDQIKQEQNQTQEPSDETEEPSVTLNVDYLGNVLSANIN